MDLQETMPRVQIGQFVVQLNPLTLLRIDSIGVLGGSLGGGPGCYTATEWTPDSKAEGQDIFFLDPKTYRFLWFNEKIPRSNLRVKGGRFQAIEDVLKFNSPQEGDVWVIQAVVKPDGGRPLDTALIFIGPDTTPKDIHVLADWEVPAEALLIVARLYQPGPGRRTPTTKTAYDHLKNQAIEDT